MEWLVNALPGIARYAKVLTGIIIYLPPPYLYLSLNNILTLLIESNARSAMVLEEFSIANLGQVGTRYTKKINVDWIGLDGVDVIHELR